MNCHDIYTKSVKILNQIFQLKKALHFQQYILNTIRYSDMLTMTIYGYLALFYVNITGCRIRDCCEFKHKVSTFHDFLNILNVFQLWLKLE